MLEPGSEGEQHGTWQQHEMGYAVFTDLKFQITHRKKVTEEVRELARSRLSEDMWVASSPNPPFKLLKVYSTVLLWRSLCVRHENKSIWRRWRVKEHRLMLHSDVLGLFCPAAHTQTPWLSWDLHPRGKSAVTCLRGRENNNRGKHDGSVHTWSLINRDIWSCVQMQQDS